MISVWLERARQSSLDQESFFSVGINSTPTDKPIQLAADLNLYFLLGHSISQPQGERIELYNVQLLWL